jgi:hypothetical protein
MTILRELQQAQADLVGKGVVLANGRAGTVDGVLLDDLHGLRITVCRDTTATGRFQRSNSQKHNDRGDSKERPREAGCSHRGRRDADPEVVKARDQRAFYREKTSLHPSLSQ